MQAIRDVLTSRFFWLSMVLTAGFAVLAHFTPTDDLGESVRVFFACTGTIALVTYFPNAMRALRERPWLTPASRGVWGVYMLALGATGTAAFGLLWRFGGFEKFAVNNPFNYYFIAMMGVGFMMMVSAPNLFGEGVPPKERIVLGSKWVIALAVVLVLAVTQPDLRWLAVKLQWILDRDAQT